MITADTTVPITPEHRVAFELNGTLAKSTKSKALFDLYLAMHDARQPHTVHFESDLLSTRDDQLSAFNFYRRSGLNYSQSAVEQHKQQSQLRQQQQYNSAWLLECLHPTPINSKNDAKAIAQPVIANAALACQWDLAAANEDSDSVLELDATLLADIVEPAQSML